MRLLPVASVTLALAAAALARHQAKRDYAAYDYYVLEHWPSSNSASPQEVALALNAQFIEQVGELRDFYLISIPKDSTRTTDPVLESYHLLRKRAKSPSLASQWWNRDVHHARRIASSVRSLTLQVPRQRTKRWLSEKDIRVLEARQPAAPSRLDYIKQKLGIQDPIFPTQWHLLNTKTPPHDMNVTGAWEMGYTGKGIISAIVDDGLYFNSDDLAANYWAPGSWDYNDHVATPLPKLSDDLHGTRCAGEVAAVRNDVCGVGVAYDSKISGVRILSGAISDADEAAALNFGYNETSIYSCSWGPPDDGRSMEAPSNLIQKAVLNGIENGRGGKGSIFVFASGNGANSGDQCNFDGYTNSIYSVTVSAVDSKGQHPYYSEPCAANMIVAYSSGGGYNIHTTDVGKRKCTGGHGGTSAAAPLAVGVFALALQARPELTWRDIQHLCIATARQLNPQDPDWEKTAQGRFYSYKYGFGALDAYAFVTAAKSWSLVKPQAWIEMPQVEFNNASMSWSGEMSGGDFIPKEGLDRTMEVTQDMLAQNNFEKLEHITVKVWINHSRRGDVEVYLVSPAGIKSVLAGKRAYDEDKTGFPGWTFMTLKHWGENPVGKWTIHVSDQANDKNNGTFLGWSLNFWGSTIDASKATLYSQRPRPPEEPLPDTIFEAEPSTLSISASSTTSSIPVLTTSSTTIVSASTTKVYVKPTEHLPEDHDQAEGESHNPTFPDVGGDKNTTAAEPMPSSTPTPDEGYFSHMGDLLSNNYWLYGGLGLVALFGIGAALYFLRRRFRRNRDGGYSSVADDEMAMTSMLHGGKATDNAGRTRRGGTKELYDAFGEVSDEEDDYADEEMALRGAGGRHLPDVGLRYHDGFLDDDTAESPTVRYRDEPTPEERALEQEAVAAKREREPSPGSASGSGTGSWEHAHASSEAINRVTP
ncbi:pheromone processing endoprotease [Tulasnella sp. 403]|nr:pheromone processing endoprotease [Tulasnella sp. 403]